MTADTTRAALAAPQQAAPATDKESLTLAAHAEAQAYSRGHDAGWQSCKAHMEVQQAAPAGQAAAPADGALHADGYFTWAEGKRPAYVRDKGLPAKFWLQAPAAEAVQPAGLPADGRWYEHRGGKFIPAQARGRTRLGLAVSAEKLALVHSEVSEALEGLRKNKADDHLPQRLSIEVELADALIRIFDLAGALELDLGNAMAEKMAYNARRADHKPEARAAAGGKAI